MQHVVPQPPSGIHGVLSVLADVADEQQAGRRRSGTVPEAFSWLPVGAARLLPEGPGRQWPQGLLPRVTMARLAALDAIRPGEDQLQVGWLWACGTDEEGTSVVEPLVTSAVRVVGGHVVGSGELLLPATVTDPGVRHRLEQQLSAAYDASLDGAGVEVPVSQLARLTRLAGFARQVAAAAGIEIDPPTARGPAASGPAASGPAASGLAPADAPLSTLAARPGVRVVGGLGIHAPATRPDFSPSGSLRLWHQRVGTTWTALHSLYLDRPPPPAPAAADVPSAFPLTTAQQAVVTRTRTDAVTVVAGAPGTGKTHTIAAIIGDVVARGGSVLVAARSEATVEAVVELVSSRPGPDPVVFGSSSRRSDLARRLAAGEPAAVAKDEVERRHDRVQQAVTRRNLLWRRTVDVLTGLALTDSSGARLEAETRLPGLFDPQVDLFTVEELADRLGDPDPRWYERSRRWHLRRLERMLRPEGPLTAADLQTARAMATAVRRLHADPDDPLDIEELVVAQQQVERTAGDWMDALGRDERRLTRSVRAARAALATALRAGRATRRSRLAELGADVTRALPVWVGTLGDVDDLLPMSPAVFDLVVLDEASSIDQPRAATALLRGARAVVVGDPQQLRHVSFVPGERVTQALHTHLPAASTALRTKLDVRRNSVFDVAAATAPVVTLDEHFRSGAHLFSFVAQTLYDSAVHVATSTPSADVTDRITLTRLQGVRDDAKVVTAEVDWVLQRLETLREEGCDSVGVLSPFRAQADAIEAAALQRLGYDGVRALGLRVGTVHAFQGMERDVVLASLGIGGEDGATTWRFADDPNLFAVMATRARERMEWVVSATPPDGSLIDRYLAQRDDPPDRQRGTPVAHGWTAEVVGHLRDAGLEVIAPYWAGRQLVDVCVHDARTHLAVETTLHPDGPHAHVRRHLELRRAGWPVVTALPAVWGDRPAELAILLRQRLTQMSRV